MSAAVGVADPATSSLRRTILFYSSAMLFCRLAAVVQGLILLRLLEPEILGIWLGLQLIPIYGIQAHLGLLNAMNRQIPFYNGRGDTARAVHVERTTRGAVAVLSGIALCILLVAYLLGDWQTLRARGALLLLLATVINVNVEFYSGLFRARHQFGRSGLANVLNTVAILAGLGLVYYWEFNGLLWRAVGVAFLTFLVYVAMDGWSFHMRFDWQELRILLRIGLPIMVLNYGIVIFNSMDRTLILMFLDDRAMGVYALSLAVGQMTLLFPNLIGQIFYPRMTESYSAAGMSRGIVKLCGQATLISTTVAAAVCVTAYLVLPWFVGELFPKYLPGLPPLRVALVAFFLLSFAAGPNYFLISTMQKRRQSLALLAGSGVMVLLAYALAGHGLVGITYALVAGCFVYVACLWSLVLGSSRGIRTSPA